MLNYVSFQHFDYVTGNIAHSIASLVLIVICSFIHDDVKEKDIKWV